MSEIVTCQPRSVSWLRQKPNSPRVKIKSDLQCGVRCKARRKYPGVEGLPCAGHESLANFSLDKSSRDSRWAWAAGSCLSLLSLPEIAQAAAGVCWRGHSQLQDRDCRHCRHCRDPSELYWCIKCILPDVFVIVLHWEEWLQGRNGLLLTGRSLISEQWFHNAKISVHTGILKNELK